MIKKYCLLALVVLALSCNVREESSPLCERVTFEAVLCDKPASKTVLQADGSVFWSPGDAINLFYGENGAAVLTSSNSDAAAQTSFTGMLDGMLPNGTDEFWAVYPYAAGNTFDGSAVILTLPDEQTGVTGTFANNLFISLAKSQDYTLQFYNLCGGIKFSVSQQDIQYVTFKGNNDEILAGQVQVQFDDNEKPVVHKIAKGATELRLNAPDGGFEVGKWYYIVSLPATLSAGYTMTFYSGRDVVAERVTDTAVTIKRSVWGRLTGADEEPVSASKYLTFTSEGTTTIYLQKWVGDNNPVVFYSEDLKSWNEWDYSELTFTQGKPLYICGDNPEGFNKAVNLVRRFASYGGSFAVTGDVMSLINKDEDVNVIPSDYCFYGLFKNCENLKVAPALPATTLTFACYWEMFYGCSSLTATPQLPATTMAEECYHDMFRGCASLTSTSALPATNLAKCCYEGMFQGCTSLTSAPELPATILAESCYDNMFSSSGITSAPVLPATTLERGCYSSMFWGCTDLTTAPDLPATTLAHSCYSYMFYHCTNLNYIKCLGTDDTRFPCIFQWLEGVASTGTFVKASSIGIAEGETGSGALILDSDGQWKWPIGANGIPEGWAVENDDGTPIISASKYLTFHSQGLTVIGMQNVGGNAPVLYYSDDLDTWTRWDYDTLHVKSSRPLYFCGNNPNGVSITRSEDIAYSSFTASGDYFSVSGDMMSLLDPNNDLTAMPSTGGFVYLFKDCSLLTSAPSLPATVLSYGCYAGLFYGCSNLTEAPVLPATEMKAASYIIMFSGCSSLTTAPELPATTLDDSCYSQMFEGCTSLAEAPELPATTLVQVCYSGMFKDCTSLSRIVCKATDISAQSCLVDWVNNVSSQGTFVKSIGVQWPEGVSGIPEGWTVEDAQ